MGLIVCVDVGAGVQGSSSAPPHGAALGRPDSFFTAKELPFADKLLPIFEFLGKYAASLVAPPHQPFSASMVSPNRYKQPTQVSPTKPNDNPILVRSRSLADMRLVFSTTDHMNTDISDERGCVYYTISTPSGVKKVTTITKYRWSGPSGVPETMGVIEWHRLKQTLFRFDGKVMPVNEMFEKRSWQTGRYFAGPDRQTYKWKMESTHCWMKVAGSDEELVRFHKKNFGIRKPSHPAYLNVSPKAVPMLDHVILTFIYVEWLRQEKARSRRNMNTANGMMMTNNAARSAGT